MINEFYKLLDSAFNGIVLGSGISLRQAEVIDNYGRDVTDEEFNCLPQKEIVDNWNQIPLSELERGCIAHLDKEGFRYYIPAFLKSVIENYDSGSMRVIGTLSSLYPKQESWTYMYQDFNTKQREAIAEFLYILPKVLQLDGEDRVIVLRAYKNYWEQYKTPKRDEEQKGDS